MSASLLAVDEPRQRRVDSTGAPLCTVYQMKAIEWDASQDKAVGRPRAAAPEAAENARHGD
jgi:hypothetical protein